MYAIYIHPLSLQFNSQVSLFWRYEVLSGHLQSFPCPSDPYIYTEQCRWKIRTHVHLHTGERKNNTVINKDR